MVVAGVGRRRRGLLARSSWRPGVQQIIGVDRKGAIWEGRDDLNVAKLWFAEHTNPERREGTLQRGDARAPTCSSACPARTSSRRRTSARWPRTRSCSPWRTPNPEIRPEDADGLAKVIATGRSDYPNQINNVLAFPGIFRGALDVSATRITEGMKLAAAAAIAEVVGDEVKPDYIVPSVFDTAGRAARGRAGGRGRGGRGRLPHRHHADRFPARSCRARLNSGLDAHELRVSAGLQLRM